MCQSRGVRDWTRGRLRLRPHLEQVEGALLQRRGHAQEFERRGARTNAVPGKRGKVLEQRAEAVHGLTVGGELALRLLERTGRALGRCDNGRAYGAGGSAIVIVKQDRRERLAHVPLDIESEDAHEDLGE